MVVDIERDHQAKLGSARANGEALYVDIKEPKAQIYSPPRDEFFAGLRRAVAAGKIDRAFCEQQIRQLRKREGVPWAVHEEVGGDSFWHFGTFEPPEAQN